jgi:hypothetical protein
MFLSEFQALELDAVGPDLGRRSDSFQIVRRYVTQVNRESGMRLIADGRCNAREIPRPTDENAGLRDDGLT